MKWLFGRLAEPSTSAGVAGILGIVGGMGTGAIPVSFGIAGILASVAAMLAPERGNRTPPANDGGPR